MGARPDWARAGTLLWVGGFVPELVETRAVHRLANAAVCCVAAGPAAKEVAPLVKAVRALGFVTLADRLVERLAADGEVTVRATGQF